MIPTHSMWLNFGLSALWPVRFPDSRERSEIGSHVTFYLRAMIRCLGRKSLALFRSSAGSESPLLDLENLF